MIVVYQYPNLGLTENVIYTKFNKDFITPNAIGVWKIKKLNYDN